MKRRTFLTSAAATAAALGLPLPGQLAGANPLDRGRLKFIFVFNAGGYDPTRVFAPEHANPNVDMEPDSWRESIGGIDYVAHADRPSVSQFFETYHDRCTILNGLLVRSIAHEICTLIAMTGSSSGSRPDWPSALAASQHDQFILPHMVLSGPSFPGQHGASVARAGGNGQLDRLLSGGILDWSDQAISGPSRPVEAILDRYILRRTAARADGARSTRMAELSAGLDNAIRQAQDLKDLRYSIDFSVGSGLAEQNETAVRALSLGIARCVTVTSEGSWDTHTNNDQDQSPLWENLFSGLSDLVERLEMEPGESEASLLDETCIVVMSEMGRTPLLNGFNGKDHWPYTSAMLIGAGFDSGRVIGGFDASYNGLAIDSGSGELYAGGEDLSAESLGATLLAMADVDPRDYVPDADPITGLLR